MTSVVSDFSAFEETTDDAIHFGTREGKRKRRDINYFSSSRGDLGGEAMEDRFSFCVCFGLLNGSQPTHTNAWFG